MPSSAATTRRSAAEAVAVVSAASVVAVAFFTSWHRSGRVHRNAFELARALDRLGLVRGDTRRGLLIAVDLVPLLAALTVLAAVERRRRLTGALAMATGFVALGASAVVLRVAGLRQPGPKLCAVVSSVAIVSGALAAYRRSTA